MIGLIALAFLVAAIFVAWLFTRLFDERIRPLVWVGVIGCAIAFPFLHFLYPSYWEYQALCKSPDRFVVHEVVPVRSVFYGTSAMYAYRFGQRHKYESVDIKEGHFGYFRLTNTSEWATPACQKACADPSVFVWEKTCLPGCVSKTPITAPEVEPKFVSAESILVEGRLTASRIKVNTPDGRKLATSSAYTYYPYGQGWASLLGGASGSPPPRHASMTSGFGI
ncbi:hypothetical protein [Paucibacter sp. M5-1]|uniref:hypothetical protein n=1 Tax=Paucibacter sp. M5-1 TaxID=3015998 RepID=UPI003F7EADAA